VEVRCHVSRIARCVSALGAVVIAVVGLTACGGGVSGDAVVRVGGSSISRAAVDHWTRVEGVLTYSVIPKQPVPRGVVPDPPSYIACVAYLEATVRPAKGQPKPTTARLKDQCEQRYVRLRGKMLDFLISYDWLGGELASRGLKVTDGEVKEELERFKHTQFPEGTGFQKYLTYTGMSVSDVLFIMKDTLLTTKLQQVFIKEKKGLTAQQQQQVLAKFKEITKKWVARTSCSPGYVVHDCKQYKGPGAL
jgi:hypothetical protein